MCKLVCERAPSQEVKLLDCNFTFTFTLAAPLSTKKGSVNFCSLKKALYVEPQSKDDDDDEKQQQMVGDALAACLCIGDDEPSRGGGTGG
jgi:hypothetical protein